MQEKMRFNAVLLERDMGHGRKLRKVVDTDTGEVVVKQNQGSIAHVFNTGANAVITEVMISREEAPGGSEHWFLKEPDSGNLIADFWRNPDKPKRKNEKPKHIGGKKPYVKLDNEKVLEIDKLEDDEIGFLFRVSKWANWDVGMLVDERTKKPLTIEAMAKKTGKSRDTITRRLDALKQAKIVTQDAEGRFFLSREFIQRG